MKENNNLNVPQQPNYYSIIPADVRYNKNLSFSAKVIFGELVALSNIYGFCFCTNDYLARLFNLNARQIQRILYDLRVNGHIKVEFDVNHKRKIYIITQARIKTEDNFYNYNQQFNMFEYDWIHGEE